MKKIKLLLTITAAFFIAANVYSQESAIDSGINWKTLEEAQKEAKATGKKIVIFGYADWCGFCRKMRKETYTQEKVQKLMNEVYIPVQLNGESEEDVVFNGKKYKTVDLARNLQLSSYPTHYFLDADGKLIGMQPGFLPADVYAPLLAYIAEDKFGEISFTDYMEQQGVILEQD